MKKITFLLSFITLILFNHTSFSQTPTILSVFATNDSYNAGDIVVIKVLWSEVMFITTSGGSPTLELEMDGTNRTAIYNGFSNNIELQFSYTVLTGDNSADLQYASVGAISLNGALLQSQVGSINGDITLPALASANSLASNSAVVIDTEQPTITSIDVPVNATYTSGQNLDFTVNTDEDITLGTTSGVELSIVIGATTRKAVYVSGTGSAALLYRYTVQAGEEDIDGISVTSIATTQLKDTAGNTLNGTLNNVGSTANVLVDAKAPTLSSSSPADGASAIASSSNIVLTFDENITFGTGNIQVIDVTDGSNSFTIDVASPGGEASISGAVLTINPSTSMDDNSNYAIQITATAIDDASGNSYTGITNNTTLDFTTSVPTVTLSLSGSPLAENGGVATVTATLNTTSSNNVTVTIAPTGTATGSGTDYTLSSTTIIINAGATTGTATITGDDDALDEDAETVIIDITGVTNGTESGTQQVTATITDDDDAPTVAFSSTTSSGLESVNSKNLTVNLSAASAQIITVAYAVTGSATGLGTDYTLANGTLTYIPGQTSKIITIASIINDVLDEVDETIILILSFPSNSTLGTNTVHTYTIADDDDAPTVTLGLSGSPLAENGGVGTITATLNAVSGKNVVVTIDPTGTATGSGVDYTLSSTTITIAAGIITGTATVTGQDDAIDEPNETIIIDISSVTNGNESGIQQVTATITDDDLNIITWTGTTDNDWDKTSNWSTNTLPIASSLITIPSGLPNYPTANSAVIFTSLTIESGASFIPQGAVTGTVTYKRTLSTNWHLVSSPVTGETYEDMISNHTFTSGSASNIGIGNYSNDIGSAWVYAELAETGVLSSGVGTSVKLATAGELSFTGTANTSDVNTAINKGDRTDFNLIGNPFTAYVNSATFLDTNTGLLSEETIWLWNGTTYETYNATNSIEIAPGQGFFVEATSSGDVTFATSNQSHQNTDIFKRPATKQSFELFVENETSKKSTKVFYVANKTTGFDNGYDSKMFSDTASNFDIFTELILENKGNKLAIQTLPTSKIEEMVIPVGLTAKSGKEVTFSVDAQNLPADVKIYLEDRIAKTFTNISENSHKVVLENEAKGTGQFYIHTTSKNLEIASIPENLQEDLQKISIYKSAKNSITIRGLQNENASVNVYSILGEKVISKQFKATGVHVIQLPKTAKGVYIVELISNLGKVTKKIILE